MSKGLLRRAAFKAQRGNAHLPFAVSLSREKAMQCKAHRKKQGDGVVSYAEPLLRNNAAMRDFSLAPPLSREKAMQCKAHRKKQGDGVVSYVEPLLRSNAAMRAF